MLGHKNDYLASKDLTKAVFLCRLQHLVKNPTIVTINRLAFDLIDTRCDNKLSVDEIYKVYETLPLHSKVFEECNM